MSDGRLAIMLLPAAFCLSSLAVAADVPCKSDVAFRSGAHSAVVKARRVPAGIVLETRVRGHSDRLWFLFDTGAARTVVDRRTARRLGLEATGKGTISGVGAGLVPVDIVNDVTISMGDVDVSHVDVRLASISDDASMGGHHLDGIIGFDLLCRMVVTLDYKVPRVDIIAPVYFRPAAGGDVLPVVIRRGWMFVTATLKVPGKLPITDEFLVDSGSQDAVNHPIIRESTGALRETRTGAGGFGESLPGVVGPNEWLRLGRTRVPSTESACCAASEEVSRQIGGAILSRFRVTFDYPHERLILQSSASRTR